MTPCALNMFLLMLGAALLGYLLAWLLSRLRTQRLESDLAAQRTTYGKLKGDYDLYVSNFSSLQGKYNDLEGGYNQLNVQLNDANSRHLALKTDFESLATTRTSIETELSNARVALQTLQNKYNTDALALQSKLQAFADDRDRLNTQLLQIRNVDSTQIAPLEAEIERLKAGIGALQAQLAAAEAWEGKFKSLYNDFNSLQLTKDGLQIQHDALQAVSTNRHNELIALNTQLNAATENQRALQAQYNALLADYYDSSNEINALTAKINKTDEDSNTLQNRYNALLADSYDDNNEINALNARLNACSEEKNAMTKHSDDLEQQLQLLNLSPEDRETAERIRNKGININFARIGTALFSQRDDLTLLKGVGDFIAKKLHMIGIYTFRQIANFTPEDEESVNEAIEFFPGRIKRERWQMQAQDMLTLRAAGIDLNNTSENELTFARIRTKISDINFERIGTATAEQANDLKALRGIGELIEKKLNLVGIYTYRQIANLSDDDAKALAAIIELFPDQIEKEQWVTQATELGGS